MDSSLVVEGLNIAELSDDDLARRLQSLGFIPGPILATTRAVYQRKLARLLRNEDFDGVDEEEIIPDAEIAPDSSPKLNSSFQSFSSSPSFNYDDLKRRPLARVDGESWSERPPVLSPHKPWNLDDIVARAPAPPPAAESPVSLTAKVVGALLLLVFAFLVYYNMDSTPTNPFPSQDL